MANVLISQLPTGTPDSNSYFPFDNGTQTQKIKVKDLNPKKSTLTLASASWTGTSSPYSQVITLVGTTSTSQVNLQGDSTVLQYLMDNGIMLYTNNNNGTITAYAVGDKPTQDLSVQATIVEVTE